MSQTIVRQRPLTRGGAATGRQRFNLSFLVYLTGLYTELILCLLRTSSPTNSDCCTQRMGAVKHEESYTTQFRPGAWNLKKWKYNHTDSGSPSAITLRTTATTGGLTTYRSVAEKDFDRLSSSSSDDEYSSADSVFDSSSVISSQSSHSSNGSDSSDDTFEAPDTFYNKPTAHSVNTRLESHKHFRDQAELLTGLESTPAASIPFRAHLSGHQSHTESIPRSHPSSVLSEKCHRRRSGSYDSTNGPPCRLKRDTDSADCFVMLLITFAARLITAIWPLSACPPMMSSCFNGAGVLPLEVFIHETLRRSKTSYSTLQVALFYIILLKDKLPDRDFTKEQPKNDDSQQQTSSASTCRAMQCGRRMFLAALMLASKYLQDRNYSTRAWSKISGLRIPEINENEAEYLRCIDYRLHMKKEAFENWSKVVLSLSKLSKPQRGCASKLESFRKNGSGTDAALAAMASESSSYSTVYSNQWWSELLKKLEPDLVNDRNDTESFLRDNLPADDIAEFLTRRDSSLPTPPTSPEAPPSHVPDMSLAALLPPRNASTPSLPTPKQMRAPSPARTSILPMRPQLHNLPTPQSTPRGTDPCPWQPTPQNQQQSLRCSASLDALRAMRKQCILNANLERCPPPRPHSLALPPVRSLVRPAESNLAYCSRAPTPAVPSPTNSVLTESTAQTTRSRSSSISSNSSWSSWASGPPRSLQAQIQSQTSSPLARVVSLPEQPTSKFDCSTTPVHQLRRKPNFPSDQVPSANLKSVSGVAAFVDEGYGSGEELANALARSSKSGVDVDAAQALVLFKLAATNTQRSLLFRSSAEPAQSSRGHKRTISKTNDPLHDHVSELLQNQSIDDQVMEDYPSASQDLTADKQWQIPNKSWAPVKKPAPNPMDTKRMALYCAARGSSASELASQYLREQLLTVQDISA